MRPEGGYTGSPGLATGAAALRGVRGVDAVEPDALRLNPECVAVGHRDHA